MRAMMMGAAVVLAGAVQAEVVTVPTDKSVGEAADAFVAAVEVAGATVFARVDHGAGAESVGSDIGDSELVIFGNPRVGTPAMLADRQLGLALPLKVLVFEDADGAVHLAYESPEARLEALSGGELAEDVTAPMAGALKNLTAKAAE